MRDVRRVARAGLCILILRCAGIPAGRTVFMPCFRWLVTTHQFIGCGIIKPTITPIDLRTRRRRSWDRPRRQCPSARVIAVALASAPKGNSHEAPPLVVAVSAEVIATLTLFRAADDGGETELLLDRRGGIRARWTRNMPGGLAAPDTLAVQAEQIARIAVAAPSHAGHTH